MATKLKPSHKRNYLSLEKKVEVIKYLQENPGTSIRALVEKFGCGRTQIAKTKNLFFLLSTITAQGAGFIQVSHALLSMLKLMKHFINGFDLPVPRIYYRGGPN